MISRRDNSVVSSSAARGIVPPPVGLYFGFMLWRVCSLRSLLQFKVNGSFLGAVCGASMSLLYLAVLAFWRSFILLVLNYGPINCWRIFRILWMLLSILSDGFSLLVQGNCQFFGWSWQKNIEFLTSCQKIVKNVKFLLWTRIYLQIASNQITWIVFCPVLVHQYHFYRQPSIIDSILGTPCSACFEWLPIFQR